eukprot:jgi/Tetstr1/451975/TSEL_039011.t1
MVALGRALMVADRVLLLDEPFQGLAPALALDYARALKRLKAEKRDIAYMITESSPDLLSSVADETLTIERGMVKALDPAPASIVSTRDDLDMARFAQFDATAVFPENLAAGLGLADQSLLLCGKTQDEATRIVSTVRIQLIET